MAKLFELVGILIYIALNVILFPLFLLVYSYIGLMIAVRALAQFRFRIPAFEFKARDISQNFLLKKQIKAITHSLHYLIVKR